MMLDKIFSIKKDHQRKFITVLGIKFKIGKRNKLKQAVSDINQQIFWLNEGKFSTKERVLMLSKMFYEKTGRFPNFKYPKTFDEKLNWMKLNYYDPNQKFAIDKYEFKNYIKESLGEGYTIPLIGVYDDINDIDFKSLPNKFVIKTTAAGAAEGVKIVKDKSKLDIDNLKYAFNNILHDWNTIYYSCLSAGYKEIIPRIIIEEYLEQPNGQLFDYKFMCFHGEPKSVLVCADRGRNTIYENHDMEWNLVVPSPKSAKKAKIERPSNFEEMITIAKKLSAPYPFVRVDLYNANNKIYAGELTFTPNSGFNTYSKSWNEKFGEWIDFSKLNSDYLQILPEFAEAAKTFIDPKVVESHTVK